MFFERSNNGWVVQASAKINLGLEVLGRLPDGYHEVETLLVPVRLCDTLVFTPSSTPLRVQVTGSPKVCEPALLSDPEQNLVTKALRLLAAETGREATGNVLLHKRIPAQAGLGGGSSDAAAALAVANHAWQLHFPTERLQSLARQLGTDVPFFLGRGAALGTGRGEQLSPVHLPAGLPLVLTKPDAGLSTPEVFAGLGLEPGQQAGNSSNWCQRMVEHLRKGTPLATWKHLIRNSLQPAATKLCGWLERIAQTFNQLPVIAHQMTGSGSGYFAVCRTWREARVIAARLRGHQRQWAIATRTCL